MFQRWLLLALLLASTARADLPVETTGGVAVLPARLGPHWAWAADVVQRRIALVDLESGRTLGVIDGGFGVPSGLFPSQRREIYLPETHYSRGSRGERTDVVTIYDAASLAAVAEVRIPPGRAINALSSVNAALSDDERFAMLCADGALLTVSLDPAGHEAGRQRSQPFFDPIQDPVTEKAVRHGDSWLFVSFEGLVLPVDVSGPTPSFGERWSLLDSTDRKDGWRIGGQQHLALHEPTGRLYSLVHQGGPDTHKQSGTELWVYDLAARRRVQRIPLRSPGFTYLGVPIGPDWIWPFNRIQDWLVAYLPELGVGSVAVTQDDRPLLVTGSNFSGSLAIYDGLSGDFLRRVFPGNMTTLGLQTPWTGAETKP